MRTPWRPKNDSRPSSPLIESLRVAIGWIAANLACETFGWRHPKNYLRVRYEDLTHTPSKVIGETLRKMTLSSPLSLEPNDARDNRHQLYGNAMRFRPLSVAEIAGRRGLEGFNAERLSYSHQEPVLASLQTIPLWHKKLRTRLALRCALAGGGLSRVRCLPPRGLSQSLAT